MDEDIPEYGRTCCFQKAIVKFPEVILEALKANNLQTADLQLLIPHLNCYFWLYNKLQLRDDQV